MYVLIWSGEEIDSTDTKEDALYLKQEYNIAYGGGVTIKRVFKHNDTEE